MRRFSQADLLNEEMQIKYRVNSLLDKAFYRMTKQSSVPITLKVPGTIHFRAEIFCEDVQELSETLFDQSDLLNLLYHDFLLYIKKNPDPQSLYNLLIQIDHAPAMVKHYQEEKSTNEFLPSLNRKRKTVETSPNTQTLMFRMKRKQALRGEVLLADLAEVYPDHQYTLERILEMLLVDFIEKLKRGDNAQAINSIVRVLCEEDE